MKIQLQTDNGDVVAEAVIPEFTPIPAVIHWGVRTFRHATGTIYRECFAYSLAGNVEYLKNTGKDVAHHPA